MRKDEQIRVIEGLMQHLDNGTNVDAEEDANIGELVGRVYRLTIWQRPTTGVIAQERNRILWDTWHADHCSFRRVY